MMEKFRKRFEGNRNLWVGVVGGALVVILVLVASVYQLIGVGERSIEAEFTQAAGISSGDRVAVSGVGVGTVTGAEIEGDHVVVSMNVDKDVKIYDNAHVTIKMATLLGARYVDLQPGSGTELEGGRLDRDHTTVPYDLADVVQKGTPEFQELDTESLATSLNTINAEMGESPELVAQALDSVGAVAKVIEDRRGEVDQLLKDLDTVTSILADNRNSVLLVITQGEAIASRVMERQELVRRLLDNVATLTRQLKDIGIENDGRLSGTIDQLQTVSEGLQKNKENLDTLLSIAPPSLRYFNNAFGDGRYATLALPWPFPDNWLCAVDVIEGCQ